MKNIILAAICFAALASCSDNSTAPETKYYTMTVSIDHRFNSQPFVMGSKYVNAAGNELQFTGFKYLLSSFTLLKSDGTKLALPNRYGFIDAKEGLLSCSLDGIPAGNYQGIEFIIGIDSVANHADPTKWQAGHPLNPSVNNLHWGWAGGYIFLAMDGNYLPSGGGNEGFSFHIGFDKNAMPFSVAKDMNIAAAGTLKLQLNVDKFFAAPNKHDLSKDGTFSHSENDGGIAGKFVQNSQGAFNVISFQ